MGKIIFYWEIFLQDYVCMTSDIAKAMNLSRLKVRKDAKNHTIKSLQCKSSKWRYYTISAFKKYYEKIRGKKYPGNIIKDKFIGNRLSYKELLNEFKKNILSKNIELTEEKLDEEIAKGINIIIKYCYY